MATADPSSIRDLARAGDFSAAWRLAAADMPGGGDPSAWSAARNVLRAGAAQRWRPPTTRSARLALLSTYETGELPEYLRLGCLAKGIDVELHVAPFGQVEQELLTGRLAAFEPTHVLLAPCTEDLTLPELSPDPAEALDAAEARWRGLWQAARELGARVLQHSFVVPDESALGHLALRLPGSRVSVVRELNRRLAAAAGADTLFVDCERLAARLGKQRWSDPRLWFATRQPFSPAALPTLADATAAVLAGDLGTSARCLVVDLDNTLWGGVVGEEGPEGITLGQGPEGEAYAAFQSYVAALAQRGVALAVASKNDLPAAREPFLRNPEMRLRLEDFAAFFADWRPKSEQIAEIAETLGLGLEALVFVDDNPAECAQAAAALPGLAVVVLDATPAERVRQLDRAALFELPSLTREDLERGRSYAARSEADSLQRAAGTLQDFWRALEMRARVRPVGPDSLERAAQLVQKTSQFNLTLRRHSSPEVERLAGDPRAACLVMELEDRFARHGLIGVGIVVPVADNEHTAEIDTLLLSCRVIGRTAEHHLVGHLAAQAAARGYTRLRGRYVPGPRNALVALLYPSLGFTATRGTADCWEYDISGQGSITSAYIEELP